MYLAFASSPETRNFICGNICLQIGSFTITCGVEASLRESAVKNDILKNNLNI